MECIITLFQPTLWCAIIQLQNLFHYVFFNYYKLEYKHSWYHLEEEEEKKEEKEEEKRDEEDEEGEDEEKVKEKEEKNKKKRGRKHFNWGSWSQAQ